MNIEVNTRHGKVRGSVADGINIFKGIPYAAPPFGANRLRPPQPVEPWSGVRDALTFGPKSPQPSYPPPIDVLIPELTTSGEDCLNLNVWSCDLGSARQPVMVWIPGGMYEYHATGACPWYDGSRFARDGIVCVTINYRVGAEGFLYLGDGIANLGLLDQVAALEWVKDNIAAFGGDPDNVTIFGESAGALSIGTLLSMHRAEGLFRRAIVQSGAAQHVISAASARRVGQILAEKLGVAATRKAIAAVPVERLLTAQAEFRDDLAAHPDPERWGEVVVSMLPWQPVVDGEVIVAPPLDRIAAGASADIDLLVGTNIDEKRLFLVPGGAIDQVTFEALPEPSRCMAFRPERHWLPIVRHIWAPALATCSQLSRLIGIGASRPSAWLTHTRRVVGQLSCTSSRGARRSSTAASAPAMHSRFPLSSTR